MDVRIAVILNNDTSRPFAKSKPGRVVVKVIRHLGDEVLMVGNVGYWAKSTQ